MSTALRNQKLRDLQFIECQNNNPTFTWRGNTYPFDPSISEFQRELETGGFAIGKLMTATVRIYNIDSNDNLTPLFPNGLPQPQQVINYTLDGTNFRIESIKREKTGAYFRLVAQSTTRGI